MALPPHTPAVLLAAVVGSAVGLFVWLFRDAPGARPLAVFMIAASVWSLAEGVTLVSPDLGVKVFWTNGAHDLVWESLSTVAVDGSVVLTETYGLAFWGHAAYSYAIVAAGALLLVRSNFRTNRHFRGQNTVLLVAIFFPLAANALSVFDIVPTGFDLTSVGFVITGLVIAGAIYNWEFLEVTPATRELGRETLIDELEDQVLILDDSDSVVDVNPAAATLFDVDPDGVIGRRLEELEPELAAAIADLGSGHASLQLASGEGLRYFDVRVTPLYREGSVAGRLVSLRDVTERQHREQRLDVLNRLLRHNLRNEMNVVRGNVELLLDELDGIDETALDRLVCVRDTVDTGPSIRFAIQELLTNALEHNDSEVPRVTLSIEDRSGRFVTVEVSDNGPGIPRQEQAVIEAGQETDLKHGSGVGLWLVSWVVRTCGGRLEFENHDRADDDGAAGCTVSLELPAALQAPKSTVPTGQ